MAHVRSNARGLGFADLGTFEEVRNQHKATFFRRGEFAREYETECLNGRLMFQRALQSVESSSTLLEVFPNSLNPKS